MNPNPPTSGWLIPSAWKHIQNESATTKEFRENWKKAFTRYEDFEKKERLISAIEELRKETMLSLLQFRECLRTLEDIALSPRVSDLNRRGYYTRVVDGRNNHLHSLLGLACFLKGHYPNEQLFFAMHICQNSLTCLKSSELLKQRKNTNKVTHVEEISFDHFVKLVEEKPVFIIFQYPETMHKMLLILQKAGSNYSLNFFDSLGITPWKRINGDEPYFYQMKELVQKFSGQFGDSLAVHSIGTTRQKDKVNCGSFVVFDFELAHRFLKEGIPLFQDSSTPHHAFLRISQLDQNIEYSPLEQMRYKSNKGTEEQVNLKASMIALEILKFYLENRISYPKGNSRFEEQSESDEEACVIS